MKAIPVLLVTLFLSACVATPPKPSFSFPKGMTVGVLVQPDQANLRHLHTGFTVFQRFENEYELNLDMAPMAQASLIRHATDNGHTAVIIEDAAIDSRIETYLEFSGVGEASFRDGKGELLQQIARNIGLDAVVFLDRSYVREPEEGSLCGACVYMSTAGNAFGLVGINSYVGLHACKIDTLEQLDQSTNDGSVVIKEFKLVDKKALSDVELDRIRGAIEKSVNHRVKGLFQRNGLGEEAFIAEYIWF
ncbi:MAG: hypothetical protein AB8G18_19825 [Gammaproteobacteria bacterium]